MAGGNGWHLRCRWQDVESIWKRSSFHILSWVEKERGAKIIIFWISLHREERLLGHAIHLGVSTFLLIYSCWLPDLKVVGCCVASGYGVK